MSYPAPIDEPPSNAFRPLSSRDLSFKERLQLGLEVERRIGHDLFDLGYWVSWPNPAAADGHRRPFLPRLPDLVVLLRGQHVGLEVRSVKVDFSALDDFPHELAAVGTIERWEREQSDPWAVVVVSRGPKGGRIVVPCRTRGQWKRIHSNPPMWGAPRECWRTWDWLLDRLSYPTV